LDEWSVKKRSKTFVKFYSRNLKDRKDRKLYNQQLIKIDGG
jgi:hypothetical protein